MCSQGEKQQRERPKPQPDDFSWLRGDTPFVKLMQKKLGVPSRRG